MDRLSEFHFLQPLWLLALVPTIFLYVRLRRQQSATSQWQKAIAPHLLSHLVVKANSKEKIRPYYLLIAAFAIAVIALASPTWQREPLPFATDEAPLVIALDLSESMNVRDIQPSRLERAKQKVKDLLTLRSSGTTALIAYSGSAHLVLPLTEDRSILSLYLDELSTEIMPQAGKAPERALALASKILAAEDIPGTILFLTDGISSQALPDFSQSEYDISLLGIGTEQGGVVPEGNGEFSKLDRSGLRAIARKTNGFFTEVTTDDKDVRQVNRHIQSHLAQVQSENGDRWQNFGYWLLYPLAIIILFWFRRGWSIQWMLGLTLAVILFQPQPALAAEFHFIDLWLTPDQQGRMLFEKGNFTEAAERFQDRLWKGISYYAAENFSDAIAQFSRYDTPEGYFSLGNAYAHNGNYQNAISSYEQVLALEPDFTAAEKNRDLVQAIIDEEKARNEQREQKPGGNIQPDDIVEESVGNEPPESDPEQQSEIDSLGVGDEQLAELWLRNVQTTPADFLRQKFQFQLQQADSR